MTTTPTPFRAEQQANTVDLGAGQYGQQIVGLPDGGFAVLWTSGANSGAGAPAGTDIIGQFYDAQGDKRGDEFRANKSFSLNNEGNFSATALPNGNFVIAYEDTFRSGDVVRTSIRYDVLDPAGNPAFGGSIAQNDVEDDDVVYGVPSVTAGADSSFLITYYSATPVFNGIESVKVSNSGTQDFPRPVVYETSELQGDLATLNSGVSISVSRYGDDILFRRIDAAGVPFGLNSYVLDTNSNNEVDSAPTVAALAGGGFVVAWENTDDNDTDIEFRVFNATGGDTGDFGTVNGGGFNDDNRSPEAIGLSDGGFVIVHDDNEDDTIKLQRFDSLGVEVGDEVTVTGSEDSESAPTVSLSSDGRLLVGWTGSVRDGDFLVDADVNFSILDPRDSVIDGTAAGETITSRIEGATVNGLGGNDILLGQGGADNLRGGDGNDAVTGGGGNDRLAGGSGNDRLDGGTGADRMEGGVGDDTYVVENAGDRIYEAATEGTNDRVMTGVRFVLGDAQVETLTTTNRFGWAAINLTGNAIAQTIVGNDGNNILNGKAANDVLSGRRGDDRFVFDTALNASTNVDRLDDFDTGDDLILLDNAIFTVLANGTLDETEFNVGRAARDPGHRIIYNPLDGALSYDRDGEGGAGGVRFATLNTGLTMTFENFDVI